MATPTRAAFLSSFLSTHSPPDRVVHDGIDPGDALAVSDLGVVLEGRTVLEGISFRVRRGTTLAIVGPNGAGKTVLLRSLLGLVPHTGTVAWADNVKIGFVPQSFAVGDLPITVREFLSLNRATDFRDCLAICGLNESRVRDERLGTLSGGELQKVLIAWALVDNPNVLVVDEPTAHIDVGAEDLILETLNRIEKERGMTILLVSHDIHNVMSYSDTALALNRTVIYQGPSKNLSDPALLVRIFGSGTLLAEHRHEGGPA
jgi:zinc transport system ATP-binding protein